jgi:hypothetical protein
MKTKKLKIAIVEDHNFYNKIIQEQVSGLCATKGCNNFKFEVTSLDNVNDLFSNGKAAYQAVIFDNHYNNNKHVPGYNPQEIIDQIRLKNGNCFFITISGYREMNISANLYQDGELTFIYSKQSALKNESHEERCSIPALMVLMGKFIDNMLQEAAKSMELIAA